MNLVFNDLWGVETALIDENQSFGFAHTIWSLSELCCFDLIFSHFSAHSRHSAARQRSSGSRPRRVRPSRGSDAGSKTISLRKKRIRKFSFSHLTFKHWRLGFTSLFVHCVCGLKQSLQPSLTWIMNCYQQDRGIERTFKHKRSVQIFQVTIKWLYSVSLFPLKRICCHDVPWPP